MRQQRILWRIYLYFLGATLAALAVTTWFSVRSLRTFHQEQVGQDLEVRARLVAKDLEGDGLDRSAAEIDQLCKELGPLMNSRVTVILAGGKVVGDSGSQPEQMGNHATRPEIAIAFRGDVGQSSRFSDTLKRTLKYVAIPVTRNGSIVAVVRVSRPLAEIRWTRRVSYQQILLGGLCTALLFAGIALHFSRRITQPLEMMRRGAQRLAAGDLDARLPVTRPDELGALAEALNSMAVQLGERIETIGRQQVEQQAVLSCMVEGVLAIDPEGRVLYINEAAARLLDVTPTQAQGRILPEVVRHSELQRFSSATLTTGELSEEEIVMRGTEEHHVQLHGAPLTDQGGTQIGGLVVMHDITRLKRLEQMRSDFVANVSHELKTPMTALKGCVETLSDRAAPPDSETTARFVAMMARHVLRLEAISEDLLSLSRIEFEVEQGELARERSAIQEVIQRAVQPFLSSAAAKRIVLTIDCPAELNAAVNEPLLEQAIGNLIDNAIKYSGGGTTIRLTAAQEADRVAIRVSDEGPGIEAQHHPRIFERFYRIDRARSRALGGTGLGLSIVKHIALAHHGNVTVESRPGHGSTFTLYVAIT
ncbi:MAG: HAMP domain-containing protein [Lentisphaerae bacterium]|nr:HAMP domain-containing protein [Lentisphaerota bacterium]